MHYQSLIIIDYLGFFFYPDIQTSSNSQHLPTSALATPVPLVSPGAGHAANLRLHCEAPRQWCSRPRLCCKSSGRFSRHSLRRPGGLEDLVDGVMWNHAMLG